MRALTAVGTRLEAIKLVPVIKRLESFPGEIESKVCATAQHREMLDQVLELFGVTLNYDLGLSLEGQTLSSLIASVITSMSCALEEIKPEIEVVT